MIYKSLIAGLALTLTASSGAHAGLDENSAWPMFLHDAQHSGRSSVNGPQGPNPQIAWEFRGDSKFRAAPVVDANGTLFAPNGKRPLTAIDPATGLELWSSNVFPIAGKSKVGLADRSQPAVSDDGRVFQGARDNNMWVTETGTGAGDTASDIHCTFHVPHDGDVTTSMTMASDGTVYMGSEALGSGWFYAMNPDCTVKWADSEHVVEGKVVLRGSLKNVSAALTPDESIVFVSIKTEAIALNAADGSPLWRKTTASKGFGSRTPNFSPTVSADGSAVYFGSKDGLWAFDTLTGDELWSAPFVPPYPTNGKKREEIKSAVALGADGTIYFGASKSKKSSHFYALDPTDGSIKWAHEHSDRGQYNNSQAAIGADGIVYVGFGRTLYAFDGDGDGAGGSSIKWQLPVRGKFDSGVILGGEGVLYAGVSKRLYKVTDTQE